MNQNYIKIQIQTILDKLRSNDFAPSPETVEALTGYYQWRLSDNWNNDTAPHSHFWINTDNDEINRKTASSIIDHIGSIVREKAYVFITEQELLENTDALFKKGKNKFIVIGECSPLPLNDDNRQQWDHVKEVLSRAQCPTFFLLTSTNMIKQKFPVPEDYERYIGQIFDCRVRSDLFQFDFPDPGDFFDQIPAEADKHAVKNVLLLTLSTTSYVKHLIKLSEDEPPKPYYYQLEPVPYQLMHDFHKGNSDQRLDGILMICSKETKELKSGKNEAFSPQNFESSAYDYFRYQTGKYAKDHCGYALSFQEINTYRESSEEKYTKLDTSEILSSVMETIRKLKRRYINLNFYVDVHGGSRTDQEILNNALSLLKMEGVRIQKEHIYNVSTPSYKAGTESHIVPAGEIFDTLDFVSGIHACANYGQAKSLSGYLSKCNTDAERNTLKNMQTVAEGIQLCDIRKFENGLSALSQSLADMETENSHTYLSVFRSLIQNSYGDNLLNPSKRTTIREIQWCIDKGFFQQALTLMESKMPKEIIKDGMLVSQAGPWPHRQLRGNQINNQGSQMQSLFTENGCEIVSDIRTSLKNDGIPKSDDGSLENLILYGLAYYRNLGSPESPVYIEQFQELPDADVFLEQLPDAYHSTPAPAQESCVDPKFNIRMMGLVEISPRNFKNPVYYFNVYENPAAAHEINVLIRLYHQLKRERNATNHAGDHENRSDLATIKNALECYIRLYNHILELLHTNQVQH